MRRRTLLRAAAAAAFVPAAPAIIRAEDTPGVTDTEIRIGNTTPYSGPASALGTIGRVDAATFRMTNDAGGFADSPGTTTGDQAIERRIWRPADDDPGSEIMRK